MKKRSCLNQERNMHRSSTIYNPKQICWWILKWNVFISCLDCSDGTHLMQRIHWWWGSDVMLKLHFLKMFFFGWNIPLTTAELKLTCNLQVYANGPCCLAWSKNVPKGIRKEEKGRKGHMIKPKYQTLFDYWYRNSTEWDFKSDLVPLYIYLFICFNKHLTSIQIFDYTDNISMQTISNS